MTMQAFLHQLLSGLADGSLYAAVALALVMIFKATHQVNFAQGEMAMFSTYIAYSLCAAGVPYWGAFVATMVFSFVLGVVVQRGIVRWLSRLPHASELTAVVVFIGLLVFFNGTAGLVWGYTNKEFPSPRLPAPIARGRRAGP